MKKNCFLIALCAGAIVHCFPGGIITQGGYSYNPSYAASASLTRGARYKILCADASGDVTKVRSVPFKDYKGGCEQEGESSVLFLLNMFPVSDPINSEFAVAMAVQRLEGDTMVNVKMWEEIHYYGLVGRVTVFKARGDVIRYDRDGPR